MTNQEKFVQYVKDQCQKHNVKLTLDPSEHVFVGGAKCGGYFDSFDKSNVQLVVATGRPFEEWVELLAHEFCHFLQWSEGSPFFTESTVGGVQIDQIVDLWLQGLVELSEEQKESYLNFMLELEKDCEERTVRLIREFDLPVDSEYYIQKSNAYVLFYKVLQKTRKWCDVSPYRHKEVTDQMPVDFILDYKNPPQHLLDLIETHCYVDSAKDAA